MAKTKKKKAWIFTTRRKAALTKAQKEHVRLVRLGESVDRKIKKKIK